MDNGILYLVSLIGTALIVAIVYSAAQDAHLPPKALLHQILRRLLKLGAVLIVLALIVHFLSII